MNFHVNSKRFWVSSELDHYLQWVSRQEALGLSEEDSTLYKGLAPSPFKDDSNLPIDLFHDGPFPLNAPHTSASYMIHPHHVHRRDESYLMDSFFDDNAFQGRPRPHPNRYRNPFWFNQGHSGHLSHGDSDLLFSRPSSPRAYGDQLRDDEGMVPGVETGSGNVETVFEIEEVYEDDEVEGEFADPGDPLQTALDYSAGSEQDPEEDNLPDGDDANVFAIHATDNAEATSQSHPSPAGGREQTYPTLEARWEELTSRESRLATLEGALKKAQGQLQEDKARLQLLQRELSARAQQLCRLQAQIRTEQTRRQQQRTQRSGPPPPAVWVHARRPHSNNTLHDLDPGMDLSFEDEIL